MIDIQSPHSQQSDTFHLSESFENHFAEVLKKAELDAREFGRDTTNSLSKVAAKSDC